MGIDFFWQCKKGILNYVILQPLITFIRFVIYLCDKKTHHDDSRQVLASACNACVGGLIMVWPEHGASCRLQKHARRVAPLLACSLQLASLVLPPHRLFQGTLLELQHSSCATPACLPSIVCIWVARWGFSQAGMCLGLHLCQAILLCPPLLPKPAGHSNAAVR